MHQEEMMTMDQLLQLYEGLHATVRRNELTIKAMGAGFVLLVLLFSVVSSTILWNQNIPFGRLGIALSYCPALLIAIAGLVVGEGMFRRINDETKDAKARLKEVVGLIHEYRQTLSDLNPVFLKAVDMRLVRL